MSFSLIGQTNHPSETITSNLATKKARRILCLQYRFLLDSSFPIFKQQLARTFFKVSGDFWFLLQAKCESEEYIASSPLEGSVLIFQPQSPKFVQKQVFKPAGGHTWNSVKENILKAQEALNKFEELNPETNLTSYYTQNVEPLLENLSKHYDYKADFTLQRNGIVKITLSNISNISSHLEHIICSQIFFFLKDSIHRHQHHHPKTDTILDIYSEEEYPENSWACEILRALYKKVLTFKRDQAEGIYSSALGVLAYVKAFKKICQEDLKISKEKLLTSRDDETLIESIKASQDDLRFIYNQSNRIRDTIRTSLLSAIGLMFTFSSLGKLISPEIKIGSDNLYIEFLAFTAINHPFNLFMLIGWAIASYAYEKLGLLLTPILLDKRCCKNCAGNKKSKIFRIFCNININIYWVYCLHGCSVVVTAYLI